MLLTTTIDRVNRVHCRFIDLLGFPHLATMQHGQQVSIRCVSFFVAEVFSMTYQTKWMKRWSSPFWSSLSCSEATINRTYVYAWNGTQLLVGHWLPWSIGMHMFMAFFFLLRMLAWLYWSTLRSLAAFACNQPPCIYPSYMCVLYLKQSRETEKREKERTYAYIIRERKKEKQC